MSLSVTEATKTLVVTRPALLGLNRERPASFELRFFPLEGGKCSTRPREGATY